MPIQKIAILGAGNGGCAAAADLTLRGFQVRLFARSESTIAKLAKLGEIELVESGVSKKAAPYFMSPHLPPVVQGVAEALPFADGTFDGWLSSVAAASMAKAIASFA